MRRFSALARLTTLCLAGMIALPVNAQSFETAAGSAFVLDLTTNTVLLEKNADVPLPPASMSKLMTLNMLFEALADGRVTLDTQFNVSERAMNMGGSTMFLTTQDRPTVDELIKGIIVLSGNDACVVVAEGLAGTEEAFATMMTDRAAALGMDQSSFGNASGWPDPRQRMSTHDLARLAARLIEEFPQYYHYFAIEEFPYDNRAPDNRHNRNPLLGLGLGADGLKTGHTQEAGYGLVGSALQGKRRVVFVLSGLDSEADRRSESAAILNWAFRQFAMRMPVAQGDVVAEAPVWLGASETVGLAAAHDVEILMPVTANDQIEAQITWKGPIEAPVSQGTELATLTITRDGMSDTVVPLLAASDVADAGFMPKFSTAAGLALAKAMDIAGLSADEAPAPTPVAAD